MPKLSNRRIRLVTAKFLVVPIFVGILLIAAPARSQDSDHADGNRLLHNCTTAIKVRESDPSKELTPVETSDSAFCIGLVRGVMDTMQMWQVTSKSPADAALHGCIPDQVTPEQAIRVVLKYLNENPAELHRSDTLLAYVALAKSFPCKK